MAAITTEGVRHVANLARLEFNDEETEHFTEQLTRILEYIGQLNELETDDVPPTSHIHPHQVFIMGSQERAQRMSPNRMSSNLPIRAKMSLRMHLNLKKDTSVYQEWLIAAINGKEYLCQDPPHRTARKVKNALRIDSAMLYMRSSKRVRLPLWNSQNLSMRVLMLWNLMSKAI